MTILRAALAIYGLGAALTSLYLTALYLEAKGEGLADDEAMTFGELATAVLLWPVLLLSTLLDSLKKE